MPRPSQVDLLIDEQIEEAHDESLEDYSFVHELVLEYVCWEASPEDDAKIPALTVADRSPLAKQLKELESFRCAKLNRFRTGSAVQRSTFETEKGALLRFLGWVSHTFEIDAPTIDLLAKPDIGEKAEAYLEWLQSKDLAWSSMANYLSSLIQCSLFAAAMLADGDFPEHQQLCNLRRQCEKHANEAALYRRQSAQWISWGDVMRTRVNAISSYNAADTAARRDMLRSCLIIMLHSVR